MIHRHRTDQSSSPHPLSVFALCSNQSPLPGRWRRCNVTKSIFITSQLVCERHRSLTSPNLIPEVLIMWRFRRAASCVSHFRITRNSRTKRTTQPLRFRLWRRRARTSAWVAFGITLDICMKATGSELGSARPLKACINFPTMPRIKEEWLLVYAA